MLPRWGRNRVEGLQTEPRAAPASGALPGFQPHLLLETESHGAWGPGSRRPFPTPVPSGPNEVGISPQLLCPRAWVLPEARPGPGARPSAPAWPGSASKTGFHGRHRSCARATAPRAPHDSVVRNWEPPPPEAAFVAKDSDTGRLLLSHHLVPWWGRATASPRGQLGSMGSQGPAASRNNLNRQIRPPPWVPITDESRVVRLQEKR